MKRLERLIASPVALLVTLLIAVPLGAGVASYVSFRIQAAATAPTPSSSDAGGADERNVIPPFIAGGTAIQNKPYFDYVNKQTVAVYKTPTGVNFVNTLIGAGFDGTAMQLTPDTTAAGLQADSIQFSVQVGELCLIGQWGDGSAGYRSQILPVVPGIGCLIGKTRPIDW